ncbi:MAG: hypothetical protein K9G30_09515 [Parvibaculum sp.]|nr:hypothetical protein [Parvibaculum sp.]
MRSYEFTFIASGIDPESHDLEDRFFEAGCDDATLAFMKGLLAITFEREAEGYVHAVVSAFRDVLRAGATVERFEPDFLVSAAEIAQRSTLTRAAISNYTRGLRGDFPSPIARIMSESPLWDWVDVSSWLFKKGLIGREAVVDARIGRTLNFVVQSKSPLHDIEKRFAGFLKNPGVLPSIAAIA